ncbi:MAG: tRNA lysidine(34) synthetase TilS [Pseudomonadota bacterium]
MSRPGSTRQDLRQSFTLQPDLVSDGRPVIVACSGGGDSIALLHMAVSSLGADRVHVCTVNHNLRASAADEIALVERHTKKLGVSLRIVNWHWDGQGNLQAKASDARRGILAEEAALWDAVTVLLGHTRDDNVESFLMALARGSGIDGLRGMKAIDGLFQRPFLTTGRAELRDWLRQEGLDWADDPSNEDVRFDRVKARKMIDILSGLGLTGQRIERTMHLMQAEAEDARLHVARAVKLHAEVRAGDLSVPVPDFLPELGEAGYLRLLAAIFCWFSGDGYKPRLDSVRMVRQRIDDGQSASLSGVLVKPDLKRVVFRREPVAVTAPTALPLGAKDVTWDHRWQVTSYAPARAGLMIGALNLGLDQCPNWRASGHSRRSLETTPAIWRGEKVIAAPLAGLLNGWTATLRPTFAEFLDTH